MRYTFTFLEAIYEQVLRHFDRPDRCEMAGYIFAGQSNMPGEVRFVGREFWPVEGDDIINHSPLQISIPSSSYCRALQHADETNQSFWFIHSHPEAHQGFSPQDDREEPALFRTAYVRIGNQGPHGSLVIPHGCAPFGRVWRGDGTNQELERIRVIGQRFRFFDRVPLEDAIPPFFDRQVRAFGPQIQALLKRLHVAVVGGGGTGSAVIEQLIRLGVGKLTVYDPQTFEASNVNRVYGSSVADEGEFKVLLMKRLAERIGLGTEVEIIPDTIYRRQIAETLRAADIVFGCTDDDLGRCILGQLALRYAIPVIDMGVLIDSKEQVLRSVTGRVTVLMPGASCLFCRGRVDSDRVRHDGELFFDPQLASELRQQGYAPEIMVNNPAVIPFTTAVACGAVTELLHRLTGFLGERTATEVLYRFSDEEVRRNSLPPSNDCLCAGPKILGRADSRNFLGMVWQ